MGKMKSLAKDTAIYGVSSILGRFLNWCLVPIYTYVLKDSAEYGIITNLYAWTALLLVLLTYGMETGFFRFMNKETENPQHVYSTTLLSIGFSSLLFAIGIIILQNPITEALGYNGYNEYIWMMGVIVAVDAFTSIPFVYLRQQKRPIKFAAIKLAMIFINIALNLFFLIVCPWLLKINPELVNWFYNPNYGVGYILIANLVSTSAVLLMLIPEIFKASFIFDNALLKRMLSYSFPLLILGVAGIANQTIDKIIFPFLYYDYSEGMRQLGIYGACFKVAMVMMMFTQAFRFAYEPFVFGQHKDKNSKEAYSDAMKFFVIFSLLIFLGMVFYLDFIKLLIAPSYWEGLKIVPIILASYLFQGIYFNLSLWYKLTDKTRYGAYFSIIGLGLNFTINFLLIPIFGYIACAWASFASYFLIMLLSYFYGQKYFPINYQLIKISRYVVITLVFFGISLFLTSDSELLNYTIKTILLITFVTYFVKKDFPLNQIPFINRFFKKKHS